MKICLSFWPEDELKMVAKCKILKIKSRDIFQFYFDFLNFFFQENELISSFYTILAKIKNWEPTLVKLTKISKNCVNAFFLTNWNCNFFFNFILISYIISAFTIKGNPDSLYLLLNDNLNKRSDVIKVAIMFWNFFS